MVFLMKYRCGDLSTDYHSMLKQISVEEHTIGMVLPILRKLIYTMLAFKCEVSRDCLFVCFSFKKRSLKYHCYAKQSVRTDVIVYSGTITSLDHT